MSGSISAIAVNTFKEAIRNKVLGSLLFFAVTLPLFSLVLGQMSLHEEVRVATDISIIISTVFSVIIAVYTTISLFHVEIERRTIYTILSKPVARWQYVIGKYLGIIGLLTVILPILFAVACGCVLLSGGEPTLTFAASFVTIMLQLCVVVALAIFFASFSSPLLSGMFTMAIFIAGNLFTQLNAMRELLKEQKSPFADLMTILEWVLPNLESLNLSVQATYNVYVPPSYLAQAALYALSYAAVALLLGIGIFSRRDFA